MAELAGRDNLWTQRVWFVLVFAGLLTVAWYRWHAATSNSVPAAFDSLLLVLLAALALAPLFSEVTVFGVSLKRQVETLRAEMSDLRSLVSNAATSSVTLHNNPAPDALLSAFKDALRELSNHSVSRTQSLAPLTEFGEPDAPEPENSMDAALMFDIRRRIDLALDRVFRAAIDNEDAAFPNQIRLRTARRPAEQLSYLVAQGIASSLAEGLIKELWTITNAGSQGGLITDAQRQFALDGGRAVLGILRQMSEAVAVGALNSQPASGER